MNKINNKIGKKIFYTIFVFNIIETIGERIFPILYLDAMKYIHQTVISIIILSFIFYGIEKGYNWIKYILIVLLFFGSIISIIKALEIYSTGVSLYDSEEITSNSVLSYVIAFILFMDGLIYISTALLFSFSKSMKSFLSIKRAPILLLSRKERLGNYVFDIGVAIAVIGAIWGLLIGLMNTILSPKLIINLLIFAPLNVPFWLFRSLRSACVHAAFSSTPCESALSSRASESTKRQ